MTIFSIAALSGAMAGVCSMLYFLGLVCRVSPFVPLIVSALICVAMVKWVRLPINEIPSKPPTRWLLIVFLVLLAATATTFVFFAMKSPHGYWDAYAIWNTHARFLVRGGTHWADYFTTQIGWSHPDYPLLVPSIIAQAWSVMRSETTFVPAAVAFLFTFGTVASLVGAVRILRGWDQALTAGAFLLGTATFLQLAVWQYADVPLAFYMVTALALLCFDNVKCTVLAGAMAGFAAWTKNEGLLFIVVLVAARCLTRLRRRTRAELFRELKWFAAGLGPVLAVVAFFKFRYAPPGNLLTGKPSQVLGHLVDFGRWVTVIESFVKHLFTFNSLPVFVLPGILVLALYAYLVRFKVDPERRTAVQTIVTAVVLMLLGDFVVYLLLSNNLDWQIDTSLDRVLLQLWPAALLAFFAASSTLELAATSPALKAPHKETKKDVKKTGATRRRS